MYNDCIFDKVTINDIITYFKSHAMTIDDCVLNVIYYNLMVNKDVTLHNYITEHKLIIKYHDQLFGDDEHVCLKPFSRASTSLLMYDVLAKISNYGTIVYDTTLNYDIRDIWNDVELKYYINNHELIDINALSKILINKYISYKDDISDLNIMGNAVFEEISSCGVTLCNHIDKDIVILMINSIDAITNNNIHIGLENTSVQANLEVDATSLNVNKRSLRSRKV